MELPDIYYWELETADGDVFSRQRGNKWQEANPEEVLRASLIPQVSVLPRHDVFFHKDNLFKGWFGRGFKQQTSRGFRLVEYAHCIDTQQFRLYVLHHGRSMITHPGYVFYFNEPKAHLLGI